MDNPYQPPSSLDPAASNKDPSGVLLASRWARLAAALVDGVIMAALTWAVILLVLQYEFKAIAQGGYLIQLKLAPIGIILFFILNGYLLKTNGQTIGKKLIGTRIALLDGRVPPFAGLIAKRYVPVWIITHIPVIGPFLNLINVLFIFGSDKRCLHDQIAGTIVVKAN